MKRVLNCVSAIFAILLFFSNCFAGGLYGGKTLAYTTTQVNFRDQQSATGFARMTNGFTLAVPASGTGSTHGASVYMDICLSVSGAIDLRATNTIILQSDLILDNGVTFSSSGRIYGYDRSVFLDGDLTIPAGNVLHIGGRIVIDGRGHKLILGNSSQLFVDAGATLTLKNLILQNTLNNPGNPPVQCATSGSAAYASKLCLDSVILDLANDFYFNRGSMFVHNEVAVSGTSALVYRSTNPSFITTQSRLYFDVGTTFSFVPATSTNKVILMADSTSQLYLNGCSFLTTSTGCRLTTGSLLFDNKVSFNSNTTMTIAGIPGVAVGSATALGNSPFGVAWSPDRRMLAVTEQSSNNLKLFSFNGVSAPALTLTQGSMGGASDVDWSPDGKFIVVGNNTAGTIQVFAYNSPTSITAVCSTSLSTAQNVAWSPDGEFIAVVTSDVSSVVYVYRFTGKSLVYVTAASTGDDNGASIAWSPDGKFLCVTNGSTLQVYQFSASAGSLVKVGGDVVIFPSPFARWSPDGRFIAVINNNGSSSILSVYSFGGGTPAFICSSPMLSDSGYCLSWSPNGKFIAIGGLFNGLRVYAFSGTSLTYIGTIPTAQSGVMSTSWSSDGNFIAEVAYNSPGDLQVFKVNYLVDRSIQALSNSIVFGNSALGAPYDLKVNLLNESQVVVDGILNYDCVS